jgi:hypothetical protein
MFARQTDHQARITPWKGHTMRYLIRIVLASLAVSLAVNLAGDPPPLRTAPKPLLAIDCGYGQPCTGTTCVTAATIHYCDGDTGSPVQCESDSQQYSGGDQICCTDRTICDSCVYRGHMTTFQSYTGRSGACTPNH